MASTINGTRETHSHVDAHAGSLHNTIECGFVGFEGKIGKEAKGSKREREYWRDNALKEPRCVEDCAIAAKGKN